MSARRHVAVVGGGPAGLMAAEVLSEAGEPVHVYDAMPSVGRKFLLAGKGGLNLTHSEPPASFLSRYGARRDALEPLISAFGAEDLCAWARGLGIATFVGTSGRVFPVDFKAAPLLRAWLHRLRKRGVQFHVRHRWQGWDASSALRFTTPEGERCLHAEAVVLALGGASWPQLGSDGAWVTRVETRGVEISPLRPSNCGFDVGWSDHFRTRHAGQPVKSVIAQCADVEERIHRHQGEFIITETGVEGGLIYALSAALRDTIAARGHATLHVDLCPGRSMEQLEAALAQPRGSRTLSEHLRRRVGLTGARAALLRESLVPETLADPARLSAALKSLPITLIAPRPLAEVISTAGGVRFEALDVNLMLRALPGVFCAGEMLDWEAPTGGYLLTACFATGRAAGLGALHWLKQQ